LKSFCGPRPCNIGTTLPGRRAVDDTRVASHTIAEVLPAFVRMRVSLFDEATLSLLL
jgi:hypothetical protein